MSTRLIDILTDIRRNVSRASLVLGLVSLASAGPLAASQSVPIPSVEQRVAYAQQFTSDKLLAKVRNNGLAFHWIGSSDHFWFRKTGPNGETQFVLVDAASGDQQPLFDEASMSIALASAGMVGALAIRGASVAADGLSIRVNVPKPGAECTWPEGAGRCSMPTDTFSCDLPVTSCRMLQEAGEPSILSPDGRQAAFVHDHNLWVRNIANGAERQLTTSGVANYAYGETHDQSDSVQIIRRRANQLTPLKGLLWSPDSRYILALRHDLRNIPERHVVTEYLPPEGGRPIVYTQRVAIASDLEYPEATLDVIDVAAGAVHQTNAHPELFADWTRGYFATGKVWWSEDNEDVALLGFRRGGREARLIQINMRDGRASDLIVERGETALTTNRNSLTGPNVKLLSSGKEAVWFSERDNWGHLYLYDVATGRVKRQVTKGPWQVVDLVYVDDAARMVYFTAAGKEAGRNPYYRALYRVGLDGGEPQLLTPENADHNFGEDVVFGGSSLSGGSMSPSGHFFIDTYSTTSQGDRVVIRKADGQLVTSVIDADISSLRATGWRPPEQFVAKAADGKTDLYGVIFKPMNFDPKRKYPVVEITYPPPASKFAPTSFWEVFTGQTTLNAHAFAENGAIVVSFDGRGGGRRSLAFRDAFVGSDDWMGATDHVAVIRNLAATRPYMDLNRVGATGHSWGGYGSLRAMLLYPDFFKVVVSGEGPGDLMLQSLDVANERLFGIPSTPAMEDYYKRISNEALAARLSGKLLLIYAGADESVPLQDALQIFAALHKANKFYDTLIMPDSPHFGGREPYGVMRTLHYFAENLGGPE